MCGGYAPSPIIIIICTGMSDRQIKAMAEHVMETFGKPFGRRGSNRGGGSSWTMWTW
jgi:ribosomal silencing factor RsfS